MANSKISKKYKQTIVHKKCNKCNNILKPILFIRKGKKKHYYECNCGIFDKLGNEVLNEK